MARARRASVLLVAGLLAGGCGSIGPVGGTARSAPRSSAAAAGVPAPGDPGAGPSGPSRSSGGRRGGAAPPADGRPTVGPADWSAYGGGPTHSGLAAGVPAYRGRLGRSRTAQVDGAVYAQPLVVGPRVIVATEDDTVYALASSTGRVLWRRHLAAPVRGGLPCGDILPSGITGTPVADPAADRVFVTTFSAAGGYHHALWALDTADGAVLWHRSVDVPGSDARAQQQRSALALLDGRVYVAYGGLDGDCSDYKGRVAAVAESGRGPLLGFTTPTQREAAVWAPAGPVVVDAGLYVATGNGTPFDAVDDSDSVLRLGPGLRLVGRFTPSDFATLSARDEDLGSTSPAVLPGGLLFQAGKQGVGYLLRADRLGGTGGQLASVELGDGAFGGDAAVGDTVVVSCFDQLVALRVTAPSGGRRPALAVLWRVTGIEPGPPVVAGGVVWDVTRGDRLLGFRVADGVRVVSVPTSPVVTSFPSLSVSASRLFVPEGREIVSYLGA